MRFPIADLIDEIKCYNYLLNILHPDGDGVREVHCNTLEGIWTGLRNFLRPFRGVHKKYLAIYVVMFEWKHNLKCVNTSFLRALMILNFTLKPI